MSPDVSETAGIHDGWNAYWSQEPRGVRRIYACLASIYRRRFIRPRLECWIHRCFTPGASLLHAGCGSGEVDAKLGSAYRITALDISPEALARYRHSNPLATAVLHADLLHTPLPEATFDGAYNLGVLEHFHPPEITCLLQRLHAVVRPGGTLLLFWPLAKAPSVRFLGWCHRLLKRSGNTPVELHPPEHTLLRSEAHARTLLAGSGWSLSQFNISPADLFIQAVLVCRREDTPGRVP